MQYNGGKAAYAKAIAAIINEHAPDIYWEPFVGAGSVIGLVRCQERYGSDRDPHIIAFLKHVREGFKFPETVTEDDYRWWKACAPVTDTDYAMKAFVGYGCSFGGKFFGGYARSGSRNYVKGAIMACTKQRPMLQGCRFMVGNYWERTPPGLTSASVVYCDPPYQNTTRCGSGGVLDHAAFWEWCRKLPCRVYVSEYQASHGFKEVWSKDIRDGLRRSDGAAKVEKLFTL